jgi:hypothetical protein
MSESRKSYGQPEEPTQKSIAHEALVKRFPLDGKKSHIAQHLRSKRLRIDLFRDRSPASLEDDFGPGNADIDRKFDRISKALLDLILTNRIDRDAFKAGEETLADLIDGFSKEMQSAKRGITPPIAEENALFDRYLGKLLSGIDRDRAADHALRTPITPNEIDRTQQAALGSYQLHREELQILGELHKAVRAINEMRDREPPDRGSGR